MASQSKGFFPIYKLSEAAALLDVVTQWWRLRPSVTPLCQNGHHQREEDYENLDLFLIALDQKWQKSLLLMAHWPNLDTWPQVSYKGDWELEESVEYLVSIAGSAIQLNLKNEPGDQLRNATYAERWLYQRGTRRWCNVSSYHWNKSSTIFIYNMV